MKLFKIALVSSFVAFTVSIAFAGTSIQSPVTLSDDQLPGRPPKPVDKPPSFVCSALCGKIANSGDSKQGMIILQVVATGATSDLAFANLQKRCQAFSDQIQKIAQSDGGTPPALQLMLGFSAAETDLSLTGIGFSATANNVCTTY